MLVRRWRTPSRATLAVLRDLAYFTSVLTVGTATVMHFLDLSRRTEELYYRALRAHKLELLKNGLRPPRSDGISHIDAFIAERLRDQAADFEYIDPRAPRDICGRRRSERRPDYFDGPRPINDRSSLLDLFRELSAIDAAIFKDVLISSLAPSLAVEKRVPSRPTPASSTTSVWSFLSGSPSRPQPQLARLGAAAIRSFSTRPARLSSVKCNSAGLTAEAPDPEVTNDEPSHTVHFRKLGFSDTEYTLLKRLRVALRQPEPWLAIKEVQDEVGRLQLETSVAWLRGPVLGYLYRISHSSSDSPVFGTSAQAEFSNSDTGMLIHIFSFLFSTNQGMNVPISKDLALFMIRTLVKGIEENPDLYSSQIQPLIVWLKKIGRLSPNNAERLFQASIDSQASDRSDYRLYKWFSERIIEGDDVSAHLPYIRKVLESKISQDMGQEVYIWLLNHEFKFDEVEVSTLWTLSVASLVRKKIFARQPNVAREIYYSSDFLNRSIYASESCYNEVQKLFELAIAAPEETKLHKVAFQLAFFLSSSHDTENNFARILHKITENDYLVEFYSYLIDLNVKQAHFSSHMTKWFMQVTDEKGWLSIEMFHKGILFALNSSYPEIILPFIKSIETGTTEIPSEIYYDTLSLLTKMPFSIDVFETFEQVLNWPTKLSIPAVLSDFISKMLHTTWVQTSDPDLLQRLYSQTQAIFGAQYVPFDITNRFCILVLKSDKPQLLFRLLKRPATQLSQETVCMIALAAAQSDKSNLQSVLSMQKLNIQEIVSRESFYLDKAIEIALRNSGLDLGLVILDGMGKRFQFVPTRRTIYNVAARVYSEGRFDLLPDILELARKGKEVDMCKMVSPISAALVRQWFNKSRPSSRALSSVILRISQLDNKYANFHLHEIWNWGFNRYQSQAEKHKLVKNSGTTNIVQEVVETLEDLVRLDEQLQPIFRTREVDELDSPVEAARLETVRSNAVIKMNAAVREGNHRKVINTFYEGIPLGIHTSPPACRQLSITCSKLGNEGQRSYETILKTLESRSLSMPLGTTEILQIQECSDVQYIQWISRNYYIKEIGRNSRYPIECSVAAAAANQLIKLQSAYAAFQTLNHYDRIVKPERPELRFLGIYIRTCRLLRDYRGVVWALSEALESGIQLDDHLFLQQADLATRSQYGNADLYNPISDGDKVADDAEKVGYRTAQYYARNRRRLYRHLTRQYQLILREAAVRKLAVDREGERLFEMIERLHRLAAQPDLASAQDGAAATAFVRVAPHRRHRRLRRELRECRREHGNRSGPWAAAEGTEEAPAAEGEEEEEEEEWPMPRWRQVDDDSDGNHDSVIEGNVDKGIERDAGF